MTVNVVIRSVKLHMTKKTTFRFYLTDIFFWRLLQG